MKKMLGFLAVLTVLLVSSVFAVGDNLTPQDISMGETDATTVEYCVFNVQGTTLDVTVDPVCLDVNGLSGCQVADDETHPGFSATPASPGYITLADGAGCLDIELETSNAGGLYYYHVNGVLAEAEVASETGSVLVPEFGVVGAGLVLAGAAVFMARKKKN